MVNRLMRVRRLPAVVGAVLVVAVIGGGSATAANLVTSKDVKDNSLRSKDIRDGSLRVKDLTDRAVETLQHSSSSGPVAGESAPGSKGEAGAKGSQGDNGDKGVNGEKGEKGSKGDKGSDASYVGPNWSVIDRNVIGNGDATLRSGPSSEAFGASVAPPLGEGSLGIRTGADSDKVAFGNQVDFVGRTVSSVDRVGFSVFTTGENIGRGTYNMPSITFEIDPNLTSTPSNYSSLVFVPNNTAANQWSTIDATDPATGFWFLTGAAGVATGCTQSASPCSYADVQARLADGGDEATIYTVAVAKGRDHVFSGAVDALRIGGQVFDFEPFGVYTRTP